MGSVVSRKGTFGQVRSAVRVRLPSHVCPPTSEVHNFVVRTLFRVLLDSMERSLSQDSTSMPMEGIGYWIYLEKGSQESKVGCPGKAA